MSQSKQVNIVKSTLKKNHKSKPPTCNAPIPAFPRVHIDGAAASALAKARLQVYMHT